MKTKLPPCLPAILTLGLCLFLLPAAQAQRMPQDSWYLAKEMKRYVEPGKFHHPHDAALGPDGNLYIADRYNHRVQVFDQEGNFIRQFGNYGSGNGEFNELTGIHVTPDGKVYVSEWHNARVQVFDAQGKFIRSMGQAGSGEGQLSGPHGVTVDDEGNVYVVEHNNHRVSVFKPDGTYLRQWGSAGSADGQFQGAIAICRTPDNKIAVLERDGNRRIQVFEPNGALLRKFTTEWSPYGIEADAAGNFYVIAREWAGFSVFSPDGTRTAVHGQNGNGSGNGQSNPHGLAVGSNKVFVCDWDNHRMAVFSTDGTWIKNFGSHQSTEQDTHGIAVDADGNIFISYHQANFIYKFSPELVFIKSFGSAGSGDGQFNGVREMAIGPNQRLYVVDHSGHRVQYFDLEGNFLGKFGGEGSGNGKFKFPWGVAVGKDNKVYVADRDNHRIQIFDADGNYLSKFGTQGSFDGQFQSPQGLAIAPNGKLAVADAGNKRLQFFGGDFNFSSKISWPGHPSYSTGPYRVSFSSDGLAYLQGQAYLYWNGDRIVVFDQSGGLIKEWGSAWCSMAETKSGDLIAAHGDRVVRVWKRTFRTVHPEPANALPLPTIVAQQRRPGTALVDVDYTVKDADNTTVQTAALAFKNGGNSLADVIPISSFAEGTGSKLGANIATGQTHRFTWDAARDWSTDFGEVQLEILAKDGRDLLNLDFIQIPASSDEAALKISRSPLTDKDFLSVWYWLIATGDSGIRFSDGKVKTVDGSTGNITGLVAEYFENPNFTGEKRERVGELPQSPNFYANESISGVPFSVRAIRWTGEFVPAMTGAYQFACDMRGQAKVSVAGNTVLDQSSGDQSSGGQFTIDAQVGVPVAITFEIRTGLENWNSDRRFLHTVIKFLGDQSPWRNSVAGDFQSHQDWLAFGSSTTRLGREFIFQRMGLREATAAEVTRAKEAGTPGVVNQWDPKLRVGPDERPAKINAYGFDTGSDGYWVVPVDGN